MQIQQTMYILALLIAVATPVGAIGAKLQHPYPVVLWFYTVQCEEKSQSVYTNV